MGSTAEKKASRGFWPVIGYRALNATTMPQVICMPGLNEVIDCVGEKTSPLIFRLY